MLTSADGILTSIAKGGAWIEISTLGRDEVQRLAALAEAQGIAISMPVTGGVHKAAEGKIRMSQSSDKALFERQ